MTRKDFELIARAIKVALDDDKARYAMATVMAGALATTNPRFNRARFIAACGC